MAVRTLLRTPTAQGLLLLAPAILIYATFSLYPLVDVVVLSFERWNGLDPTRVFVGTQNYVDIFTKDPVFWTAFRNTFLWTGMAVIFPPLMGLMLALGLNQRIFGRVGLRAVYYLPVIIAPIAVATMWRWMYDPFFGVFTQLMTLMGFGAAIPDWLGDQKIALYSVFVAYVWQYSGFSMVLFLAGLQGVEQTLIEAARIDGAGRWGVFKHVTLPALRPTITIVLVLATISSLKAFDIVYGLTGGGPAQSTQMLALWAFTQSMQILDFGRGSAVSVVLLVITVSIVIPYLRWSQKREEAEQ
jgi:raffinose/stachyose/melibiose transport system permease protein